MEGDSRMSTFIEKKSLFTLKHSTIVEMVMIFLLQRWNNIKEDTYIVIAF